VLYLQTFRERGLWQTCQFFQELRRLYGRWAAEAIVDGGPRYQGMRWRLRRTKRVRMVDGIRNYVERFFRELKQGLKPFDVSFPQRQAGADQSVCATGWSCMPGITTSPSWEGGYPPHLNGVGSGVSACSSVKIGSLRREGGGQNVNIAKVV
jgi:hypothetical protein